MNRNWWFVGLLVSIVVLLPLLGLWWYRGYFSSELEPEKLRFRIDAAFENAYRQNDPYAIWFNRVVFKNGDKFAWRPPRILATHIPTTYEVSGYEFYGVVTRWRPDVKLLHINTYIGKPLTVRFDPDSDRSIAIIPKLDAYGKIIGSNILPVVQSMYVPDWNTLFCESDIVSIKVRSKFSIMFGRPDNPLIPVNIVLTQRLCQV